MSEDLDYLYNKICIPIRLFLGILLILLPNRYMKYLLMPLIVSIYIIFYRFITHDESQQGLFKQKVHWQNMRLGHMANLMILVISIASGQYNIARTVPILDVIYSIRNFK
jgi:hypothetical protein